MTLPIFKNRTGRRAGFTLLEMLVVLAIISIMLGVSVGVLRRNVPRRDLARNALLDKLRRARLFAVAEQSPAWVLLHRGSEERWPTVTAVGRRTVGTWHLEGEVDGYPNPGSGAGIEEEPIGILGKAVRLAASEVSYLNLGAASRFESEYGLAFEMFVKLSEDVPRTLFSKGDVATLSADEHGGMTLAVELLGFDEKGKEVPVHETISTRPGVLRRGRWQKVGFGYDGLNLRLLVEDVVVEEATLTERRKVNVDPDANIVIGQFDRPFAGSVDEARFGIYISETSEPLQDVEIVSQVTQIRFAPGGELDPGFHAGALDLGIRAAGGGEAWVRVGILGDVN